MALYTTVYHCRLLDSTVEHCIALQSTVWHCTELYIIAEHCIALQISLLHCRALYGTVQQCMALHMNSQGPNNKQNSEKALPPLEGTMLMLIMEANNA